VECGFLSNPAEAEKLAREDYRHALAALIFGAVAEHTVSHTSTAP
jgi:N-acetylmuramoyl-L-alanine amidase